MVKFQTVFFLLFLFTSCNSTRNTTSNMAAENYALYYRVLAPIQILSVTDTIGNNYIIRGKLECDTIIILSHYNDNKKHKKNILSTNRTYILDVKSYFPFFTYNCNVGIITDICNYHGFYFWPWTFKYKLFVSSDLNGINIIRTHNNYHVIDTIYQDMREKRLNM